MNHYDDDDAKDREISRITKDIISGEDFHELFCDENLQEQAINFIQKLVTGDIRIEMLNDLKEAINTAAAPIAEKMLKQER